MGPPAEPDSGRAAVCSRLGGKEGDANKHESSRTEISTAEKTENKNKTK